MTQIEMIESASANEIAQHIAAALASGEGGAISLPGGSTPFPIFEELVKCDLKWGNIAVWPGDDRIVPEDHAASNTGKIRSIFEPAGARVVALAKDAEPPRFALCWLGMGADGHVASLFPNTDPQVDDVRRIRRLTPDPLPPEAPFDRITMTIPALLNAEELIVTLGGSAEKREVFEAALRDEHDLPIARLLGAAKAAGIKVTCFT